MSSFKTLDDLPADLTGQVALVRVDLNLPMKDGAATDVTRVEAAKPTILELTEKGAKVLLLGFAAWAMPRASRARAHRRTERRSCEDRSVADLFRFCASIEHRICQSCVQLIGDLKSETTNKNLEGIYDKESSPNM